MKYFSILFFLIISFFLHAQIPFYVPTNGLKGWWPFCNNANDLTVNANNGTVYGASLTTDRFGNANNAYFFNGSSYIATTYVGVLGANKRAVSFWAKTSNSSSPMTGVSWGMSQSYPNTGKKFGCEFNVFSSGLTIDGADCAITYNPPTSHADNNWHHYVYQMDSAALLNQVQIFMDGVLVSSVATDFRGTSTMITLPNYNVWFGKMDPGLPYYFNGSLDDIAIWNRKLTQTEITALFNGTSPCTASTTNLTSDLVICMPLDGNASDFSGNNNNGTMTSVLAAPNRFGNPNSAVQFNGVNSKIVVPASPSINNIEALDELTVTSWCNINGFPTNNCFPICNKYNPVSNWGWDYTVQTPASWNGQIFVPDFFGMGGSYGICTGNEGVTTNQWDFYAITFSKSTSTFKVYKNAVLLNTSNTGLFELENTANGDLYIGCSPAHAMDFADGFMDDFRMYSRALNQAEITALYTGSSPCSSTTITPTPTPTIIPTPTISVIPLPNVITPNNDDVNDYIDFSKHVSETNFDFEIFDRWGLSMLKSNSKSKTIWDGTTNSGQKCVDGVYFYIIKTTYTSYKGNISLFR